MRQVGPADPQMARLDPSASRLKYRMERLMLTPLFRLGLKTLPYAVVIGAGVAWFSAQDNRDSFMLLVEDVRDIVESRPEFQIQVMAIDGAGPQVSQQVRQVLPIDFPISSFDLSLEEMQAKVTALDAVQSAQLRIRQGVLQIDIVERQPSVLWRTEEALTLLDNGGVRVGTAESRSHHADLPVIAGEGAEIVVGEALELYAVAGPLRGRLRGFERMGERRWDVVLDRDQRILLPESGAVRAFERTIAMDQAVDMLSRDLLAVDLRLPHRPTIRMSKLATQEMWRIKAIEAGGVQQQ